MSSQDTLVINDHDTVTNNSGAPGGSPTDDGSPTLDGKIDLDMLAGTGELQEPGYVNGAQVTFDNGTEPPVLFRGIRHRSDGRIWMGFLCRINTIFADDNAISIILKPSHGSATRTDWRKINIYPIGSGGAEGGAGTGLNDVRTDRDPRDVDFWSGTGTDGWQQDFGGLPPEVRVKVRSWVHNDTMGNPSEFAWSVEVEMDPTNGTDGSGNPNNWIDLSDDFGVYFRVVKVLPVGGTNCCTIYQFPLDAPAPADPNEFLSTYNPTKYGRAFKDTAIPANPEGIGFEDGWRSIGRRPDGSSSTTLESWIETGTTTPGVGDDMDNEIVAFVTNTAPAGGGDVAGVSVEFRFANWGLGGPRPWRLGLGRRYDRP